MLLGLALFSASLGGAAIWAMRVPDRPGPLTEARDIVIKPGGVTEVADQLVQDGVIDSPFRFKVLTWLTQDKGHLRAGEFAFPRQASPRQVLTILRTARQVEYRVTIPEGLTAPRIREIMERAPAATGSLGAIAEGSLLPATYSYERGMARSALVARGQTLMNRELAAAWADRAPDLGLTSPREMLILASIVERDTGREEERSHVAAVFLNRLRLGMRLQSDPTVIYAVSGGVGTLDRKITRADLDRDDPFNTYRYPGLPPGPISTPGAASLRAVARPAKSDDLYFVADGDGGHAFSRTLDAHNRNVARWRERATQ